MGQFGRVFMHQHCASIYASRCRQTQLLQGLALLYALMGCIGFGEAHAQAVLVLQPGATASTLAGNGMDGRAAAGDARLSPLGSPQAIAYDSTGNLLIADTRNHQVLKVDSAGLLTIVAGTGRQGYAGDGGPATAAEWNAPAGLAVDSMGNVFVADTGNQRVRRIAAADGIVSTVAGTGAAGFSGDGGAAIAARFRFPASLALDAGGVLYIADVGNHRIRKLQTDGTVRTVAGTGAQGQEGDGGAATAATLDAPSALTLLPDGRLLIADQGAHRLRTLQPDGTISAFSAGALPLRRPDGLAADAAGSVYVVDSAMQTAGQISADGSSSFAGNGKQGAFLAGSPLATALNVPAGIAFGPSGAVAIGDTHNRQVQSISVPSLNFGTVPAGSSSQTQTLTLQNGGTAALTVLALELPTSFASVADGTTCAAAPFTLQAAGQCQVAITFAPNAQGVADALARARTLGGAPQPILLTGTAVSSGSLAGSLISLHSDGNIAYLGSPITLTATVAGSLLRTPAGNITFLDADAVAGTAVVTNSGATLTTAALLPGAHALRAIYSGDAVYSRSTSAVVQIRVVPAPDFTVTASAASYSGSAGGTITIPMTLLPINGTLNQPVQFAVSGLPAGTTATFAPATMTLGGDSKVVTLTLQLPVTLASKRKPDLPYAAVSSGLILTGLLLRRRSVLTLLTLICCAIGVGGCGSGFRAGTTATDLSAKSKTYSSVVTATTTGVLSNTLTHSTSIGLVITK